VRETRVRAAQHTKPIWDCRAAIAQREAERACVVALDADYIGSPATSFLYSACKSTSSSFRIRVSANTASGPRTSLAKAMILEFRASISELISAKRFVDLVIARIVASLRAIEQVRRVVADVVDSSNCLGTKCNWALSQ